jgi:hypothetical protein
MPDEMRRIIDSIVPPVAVFGEDEDGDEGTAPEHPPSVAQPHAAAPPPRTLLPRQEAFCRNYVTQPVATRAAVLAGYAERSAYNQGHRLLHQSAILERIAELRAERSLRYVIERDTSLDKLEAVFQSAFGSCDFAPALAALRFQAQLAGLLPMPRGIRRNDEKKRARRPKKMRKPGR